MGLASFNRVFRLLIPDRINFMIDRVPSSSPVAVRRSFQLSPTQATLLGIGIWVMIGLLGLFDQISRIAGENVGLVYLFFLLVLLPSIFSHVELRKRVRTTGGSYLLIRSVERPTLAFYAGWIYLLGLIAIQGLIVWTFADHLGKLLQQTGLLEVDSWVLAAVLILFFTLSNLTIRRPPWRTAIRFTVLVLICFSVLGLVLLGMVLFDGKGGHATRAAEGTFFSAVALLAGTMWVIELIVERQQRSKILRSLLGGNLGGLSLAAFLGLIGWIALPANIRLVHLTEQLLPGTGSIFLLAISILTTLILGSASSLIQLRQIQVLARDGVIPLSVNRPTPQSPVPHRITLVLSLSWALVAALAFFRSDSASDSAIILGQLAAFTFLLLQIGFNAAAIVLLRRARSSGKQTRQSLFPIIPATGIAICFLLLFAIPTPLRVAGVVWLALGGLAFWIYGRHRLRSSQLGVTVFQDTSTQADLTSEYPVLVPVANPATASGLVEIGASIARHHGGHVVLLQVILVPEQLPLDTMRYKAQRQHGLLDQLLAETEKYDVPVEGVTRLSRSISQGILDTVREESAKLIVMGSNISPLELGQSGFGELVDDVLDGAASHVAVVRGYEAGLPGRVLIPTTGGVNTNVVADLGFALTAAKKGQVSMLCVLHPKHGKQMLQDKEIQLGEIVEGMQETAQVKIDVIQDETPLSGILRASQDHDLILLAANEPGFLEEEQLGRLPLRIAEKTEKPFILLRSHAGLPSFAARRAWRSITGMLPRLRSEDRIDLFRRMRAAASPNINYFVLIGLSAVIATLGLLLNSPAVVIGAMLVAPLMSPIVAIGTGIAFGDVRTLRDALATTIQGILAAVFIAILVTLILPVVEATPEILARTQPNIIDLLVALASGMAGAYAISRREVGEALPGVAIAAALLPPLASTGIGIAMGDLGIAIGALLLFTTNLITIVFSTVLVLLLLGVRPPRVEEREQRLRQGLQVTLISLIIVSLPLGYALWQTVRRDRVDRQVKELVASAEEQWEAVEVRELQVYQEGGMVSIVGTLFTETPIPPDEVESLRFELETVLGTPVEIRFYMMEGLIIEGRSE
jgi:uncharacterized hydrophobic protein (TIGR00271 family)